MTSTTSGCTRSPGCVPADTATALEGSAKAEKNAAAIWERPALWTHAKMTRSILDLSALLRDHDLPGDDYSPIMEHGNVTVNEGRLASEEMP